MNVTGTVVDCDCNTVNKTGNGQKPQCRMHCGPIDPIETKIETTVTGVTSSVYVAVEKGVDDHTVVKDDMSAYDSWFDRTTKRVHDITGLSIQVSSTLMVLVCTILALLLLAGIIWCLVASVRAINQPCRRCKSRDGGTSRGEYGSVENFDASRFDIYDNRA
jgi:hypothetical protein